MSVAYCYQMLRGDCAKTLTEIDRTQTAQHGELVTCVQHQQDLLKGAAQGMSEWSCDMRESLEEQGTQVDAFIDQELVKDIPTGEYTTSQEFCGVSPHTVEM